MHRPAATTAFTLIELLVVISIILLLMGMLFAGIRMAKQAAVAAKTQTTISQLTAACESYRQVNGRYPEGGDFDTHLGLPAPKFDATTDAQWASSGTDLAAALNLAGESFKAPLLDGWKKQLRYRPAKSYPYDTSATLGTIDSNEPPARDSFQLWSMGKDLKDQGGVITGDDITSWPKQ